jgi:hypothetical protein
VTFGYLSEEMKKCLKLIQRSCIGKQAITSAQFALASTLMAPSLRAGQIIRLGPRQGVVLAYMNSCLRETITGPGAVTVGTDRSEVQSGEIKRTGGQCALDKATFPNAHGEFGARTFRGPHGR